MIYSLKISYFHEDESNSAANLTGSTYNNLNNPLFDMDISNAKKAFINHILGDTV
jgi:hypothetical protein